MFQSVAVPRIVAMLKDSNSVDSGEEGLVMVS